MRCYPSKSPNPRNNAPGALQNTLPIAGATTPFFRQLRGHSTSVCRVNTKAAGMISGPRDPVVATNRRIETPRCSPAWRAVFGLTRKPSNGSRWRPHGIHPVRMEDFLAQVEPGTRFEIEKSPVEDDSWLTKHYLMRERRQKSCSSSLTALNRDDVIPTITTSHHHHPTPSPETKCKDPEE